MPSKGTPLDAEDPLSGLTESADEGDDAMPVYYPSNVPGAWAVNAISGTRYPYKTGSLESLQLFQVTDSTGAVDQKGYAVPLGVRAAAPNQLFYNSPAEYADHRGTTVPPGVNERWASRIAPICPDGVFRRRAAQEFTRDRRRLTAATGD